MRESEFADKDIDIYRVEMPFEDEVEDEWATPIWVPFYDEFKADVLGDHYNTIVVDTATNMETVLRQYILEWLREQQDKPDKQRLATNEYTARNLTMNAVFDRADRLGKNLVTTQYVKERWVKYQGSNRAEPTGEMILDGWNQTEGKADINLEMEAVSKAGRVIMVTTIKSNRFNRNLAGTKLDDTDYDELVAVTF